MQAPGLLTSLPAFYCGRSINPTDCRDLAHRDGHVLDLCVIPQSVFAQLAADAAHLESAERRRGVEDVVAVDPHRPGPELGCQAMCLADIAGPHGRRQAV